MFDKTTSHIFKNFGNLVYDNIDFSTSHKLKLHNKNVKTLNIVKSDNIFIKVTKGVVMMLVSNDDTNIKSFIINRVINLKKDVYFNLISISDDAEIEIIRDNEAFDFIYLKEDYTYTAISPSLNITEIYTKFYQEKGINYTFSGESHPYWELTYVDKGELLTTVDNKDYYLKQGDLIFYAPLQFHTQSTLDNHSSSYLTINFNMNFDNNEYLCNKVFTLQRDSHFIIKKLIDELSSNNIYSNDLSLCHLKELIIQTLRLEKSHFTSRPTTHMQQTYESNLLNDILKFIDNNMYEKIGVDTICNHFCVSQSMLHSLFKKNMNNTVKNYINDIKLSKSKELIKNSTYTLSEISEMLGFSSIHYFSKKFKSYFGISPTEYSKSLYN